MDPATGSSDPWVSLHQVDNLRIKMTFISVFFGRDLHNGIWLEVYVSVKRKQERVVCSLPLLLLRFQAGVTFRIKIKIKIKNVLWLLLLRIQTGVTFQLVTKEVVHVHDLRPPDHNDDC